MNDPPRRHAPQAAGVIHTDFERVTGPRSCPTTTSSRQAHEGGKAAGRVRMEGKDYVMADGDVVEFRLQRGQVRQPAGHRVG